MAKSSVPEVASIMGQEKKEKAIYHSSYQVTTIGLLHKNEGILMYFETPSTESRLPKFQNLRAYWVGVMEGGERRDTSTSGSSNNNKRPQQHGLDRRAFSSNYFSMESFLVLVCLTASLLILPLVLPPLPPPPFLLLLLPVCMLLVLIVLAFMPSDIRNIASSYL